VSHARLFLNRRRDGGSGLLLRWLYGAAAKNQGNATCQNERIEHESFHSRLRLGTDMLSFIGTISDEILFKLKLIENVIRPSALGNKLMFIGHPEAGERCSVVYPLLGSCCRHGINPLDYLKDLFAR
jgi:hypothetical protein